MAKDDNFDFDNNEFDLEEEVQESHQTEIDELAKPEADADVEPEMDDDPASGLEDDGAEAEPQKGRSSDTWILVGSIVLAVLFFALSAGPAVGLLLSGQSSVILAVIFLVIFGAIAAAVPILWFKSRETINVYEILLGIAVVAMIAATMFCIMEWAAYDGQIKASARLLMDASPVVFRG